MRPVLGIVGTGLIGGSIGLRARSEGWHAIGYDVDAAACERALRAGAIDDAASFEALVARADAIAIAAFLEGTLATLERLKNRRVRARLVFDTAPVKRPIVAAATGLRNFVATHPIAGGERGGAGAARDDLFDGASWAYVPSGDAALDRRACEFVAAMGAVAFAVDAAEHDRVIALTSHLPQLVAWCYRRIVDRNDARVAELCGPVARQLLRIGSMDGTTWRDALRVNAPNVGPALRELVGELGALPFHDLGAIASEWVGR